MPNCDQCGKLDLKSLKFCVQCGNLMGITPAARGLGAAFRGSSMSVRNKDFPRLLSIIADDEVPEFVMPAGWLSYLIGSDRRLIFAQRFFFGYQVKAFTYSSLQSYDISRWLGRLTLNSYGASHYIPLRWSLRWSNVDALSTYLVTKISPTPLPASTSQASGVADELLKFSELLDKGVITQEEFAAQKAGLKVASQNSIRRSKIYKYTN